VLLLLLMQLLFLPFLFHLLEPSLSLLVVVAPAAAAAATGRASEEA